MPSTISNIPSTAWPTATNVFNDATTPTNLNVGHDAPGALTVGMRFQASVPGQITGISFWQDAYNVWESYGGFFANGGGAPLATATAADPIVFAAAWRTISFATPVTITPGTTYVAAVYMANGNYDWTTLDPGTFNAPIVNGVLTGLQTNPPGNANGVYDYGAALTFPTSSFTLGTNYWVDPVFAATPYNRNDVVFNGGIIGFSTTTDLNINTKRESEW